MTVTATWFGAAGEELLGVWHLPAGEVARGAVVLCPPLGKEGVHGYRTTALAAQLLSDRGVAVLRFDYRGTGDSTGQELEPDAVARWQADVVTAVAHAREVAGIGGVALAGLRAGALLAGTAAVDCGPLAGLALWDPAVTGRAYVREQTVLYQLKVGRDDDAEGAVSLVGGVLHPCAATALKALSLATVAPADPATPVLVASRAERADNRVLTELVERVRADQLTVTGHELVFDVATFEISLPGASTTALAEWLATRFDGATHPVSLVARASIEVGCTPAGAPVRERLVRLGPHQLFAVVTEPAEAGPESLLVVTLPSSTEHRAGTGRIWVDLARRLAIGGEHVVRFDRRGTGDSGLVDPSERVAAYGPTVHEDLDDVLNALGQPARDTALVGHCSGAWLAGEAAAEGRAASVVLLGAARFSVGRQHEDLVLVDDPDRAALALTNRSGRLRTAVKAWIPGPLWRWLGRHDLAHVPELVLARLRAADVATTLVLAPVDYTHFDANRGVQAVERLKRGGWPVHVHAGRAGDHALVHHGLRIWSIEHVVSALQRAPDPAPAATGSGSADRPGGATPKVGAAVEQGTWV